jgi:hypothetical protein
VRANGGGRRALTVAGYCDRPAADWRGCGVRADGGGQRALTVTGLGYRPAADGRSGVRADGETQSADCCRS